MRRVPSISHLCAMTALRMLYRMLSLFAFGLVSPTFAQGDLQFDGTVPVTHQGNGLYLAWSGGIDYAQFSQVDLDQDGLKDLVYFDRVGNTLRALRNTGGSGTGRYVHTREYDGVWPFPELHDWVLLRDYNCDGKEDIFSYTSAGFAVYRNTSTSAGLAFELVTTRADCEYVFTDGTSLITNLYTSPDDLPGIADVDSDGDLDILVFSQLGTYVSYYKNESLESGFGCDSLKFVLSNLCWGRFAENVSTNDVTLNVDCQFQVPDPELGTAGNRDSMSGNGDREVLHAGSTVTPIHLNGDGVMDVLLGDISYPNLVALTNGGTLNSSNMVAVDDAFPSYDVPVVLPIFPAPFQLDVDGDEVLDLLVCPSSRSLAQNYAGVWFYKNNGTDALPVFEFQQQDLFQGRMVDVGSGAYPIFFDHNGDGLQDIVLANDGYYDPSLDYTGKLALFLNVGSATDPAFDLETEDYMGLSTSGIGSGMYPAFADLDGDGDPDLLIGDLLGGLHQYRNTGTITAPVFELLQPNITYANGEVIDLGRSVTPHFVDLDEDGLMDLVVGEENGNLNYVRNSGTSAAPAWTLVTDSLGGVRTNTADNAGFSVPVIYRNALGERELLVGTGEGTLWHYTGLEGNLTGDWTLTTESYLDLDEGNRASVALHDLTGDGELDLIMGNYRGGIGFWRSDPISGIRLIGANGPFLNVWPNPTTGTVEVSMTNVPGSKAELIVYNTMGQVVHRTPATGTRTTLSLGGLDNGIYTVHCVGSAGRSAPVRVVKSAVGGR